jgi:hypothetical protein
LWMKACVLAAGARKRGARSEGAGKAGIAYGGKWRKAAPARASDILATRLKARPMDLRATAEVDAGNQPTFSLEIPLGPRRGRSSKEGPGAIFGLLCSLEP